MTQCDIKNDIHCKFVTSDHRVLHFSPMIALNIGVWKGEGKLSIVPKCNNYCFGMHLDFNEQFHPPPSVGIDFIFHFFVFSLGFSKWTIEGDAAYGSLQRNWKAIFI